ncbi:MAG TPA: MtrB/PioB family outer membrane beta-barrel protein, partial [Burkholderiaceae bacterium]|nr:MtrB/PioB family outer membrane beta-barrel protein [Burkholderiaceae bacterium]
ENGSVFAYVTQQRRQRDMTNTTNATGSAAWSNNLTDDNSALVLGFNQTGLMAGRFDLAGDLTYSLGKATFSTLNPTVATCATAGTCGSLPDIRSEMYQFKLTGGYRIDKNSRLSLQYLYQRLRSNDYYYNGLQAGFTPTSLMPTNQQADNYNVNAVAVTYIYSF